MDSYNRVYHRACYSLVLSKAVDERAITFAERAKLMSAAKVRAWDFRAKTNPMYELGRSISYAN